MMISSLTARIRNFRRLYAVYAHTRHAHHVATQLAVLRRLVGEMLRGTLRESEARIVRQLACLLDEITRLLRASRPAARRPKKAA